MAWRGRAKKGHGADLVKPEVLEINEEVCGGVRTLQITAKRGLDAEEDSTTARSASRSAPRAYTHAAAVSHSRVDVWPLRPVAPLLCQCLVAFLCGACSLHPPPSLALSVSLSGPLSCQSAFCGLLRDEESEQFHVTSVATASSGRGLLGYLAAPAALTVRNCLISKVTSGKSSESSMTVRRPTDGGRPNPRGSPNRPAGFGGPSDLPGLISTAPCTC